MDVNSKYIFNGNDALIGFYGRYDRSQNIQSSSFNIHPYNQNRLVRASNSSLDLYQVVSKRYKADFSDEISQLTVLHRGRIWQTPNNLSTYQSNEPDIICLLQSLQQTCRQFKYNDLGKWEGNFSISYFDIEKQALILYRSLCEPFSLYFREIDNIFEWCTHPTFMHNNSTSISDLNLTTLPAMIAGGQIDPSRSIFRWRRCPAGMIVYVTPDTVRFETVVDFNPNRDVLQNDLGAVSEQLYELSISQTHKKISKNNDVGILLSGGLDSASVSVMMQQTVRQISAIHWSARKFKPADETDFATNVSKFLDIPQYNIDISEMSKKNSALLDVNNSYIIPYPHTFLKFYELSAVLAEENNIKVLSLGSFSDLLFSRRIQSLRKLFFTQPANFWRVLYQILGTKTKLSLKSLLRLVFKKNTISDSKDHGSNSRIISLSPILVDSAIEQAVTSGTYYYSNKQLVSQDIEQTYNAVKGAINSELNDALSDLFALHDIHFLHPYLDRRIVNYSMGFPFWYGILPYGGEFIRKPVLRQAYADKLPKTTLINNRDYRTGYAGFVEHYCINNIETIKKILLKDSILIDLGILDANKTKNILNNYSKSLREMPNISSRLTAVCIIEKWLKSL